MTTVSDTGHPRLWPLEFEQILRRHCRFADPATPIDPAASLVLLGMESFQVLSMIVDIEDTFAVTVPDTMLTGDQFATAASVWRSVGLLLAVAGGPDG
jgi:diaminopimelate decarboxylase